ncbi:hypothetical protein BaRGS_00031562 [Batillaria attramentaria]|uniref:Uncharacterized protein n=1 Tax=Batillaria attramentaria TaxID=370345 RepID=A0ABD0JQM2_9CAEN
MHDWSFSQNIGTTNTRRHDVTSRPQTQQVGSGSVLVSPRGFGRDRLRSGTCNDDKQLGQGDDARDTRDTRDTEPEPRNGTGVDNWPLPARSTDNGTTNSGIGALQGDGVIRNREPGINSGVRKTLSAGHGGRRLSVSGSSIPRACNMTSRKTVGTSSKMSQSQIQGQGILPSWWKDGTGGARGGHNNSRGRARGFVPFT